jgi:hypothetical protein
MRGVVAITIAGAVLGASLRSAQSDPSAGAPPSKDPNVVVLRSEKTITIREQEATLKALAEEMKRQTGYTFVLEGRYAADPARYAVFLKAVPLTRALNALGYAAHGRWSVRGRTYTLRPPDPAKPDLDPTRYEAICLRAYDLLKDIDPKDESLGKELRYNVEGFRWAMTRPREVVPPMPSEATQDWTISGVGGGNVAISGNALPMGPGLVEEVTP